MVATETTDKTAFSALCGHQLMVELKCNDKNGIEECPEACVALS